MKMHQEVILSMPKTLAHAKKKQIEMCVFNTKVSDCCKFATITLFDIARRLHTFTVMLSSIQHLANTTNTPPLQIAFYARVWHSGLSCQQYNRQLRGLCRFALVIETRWVAGRRPE